jgi:hypothetical protein
MQFECSSQLQVPVHQRTYARTHAHKQTNKQTNKHTNLELSPSFVQSSDSLSCSFDKKHVRSCYKYTRELLKQDRIRYWQTYLLVTLSWRREDRLVKIVGRKIVLTKWNFRITQFVCVECFRYEGRYFVRWYVSKRCQFKIGIVNTGVPLGRLRCRWEDNI